MRRSAAAVLLTLGVAVTATAYVPTGDDWTWQGTPISDPFLINAASFPGSAGSTTAVRNRIAEAMDVWGTQGGADFRYVDGGNTTSLSWNPPDTQNILQWHASTTNPAAVALAQTWVAPPDDTVECDIRFYGANGTGPITWSSKPAGANPGEMDIAKIAIHELGHCLGLNHSADPTAIMFASTLDGSPASERVLAPDDIAGLQAIYGVLTADLVQAGSSIVDLTDGDGILEPGDYFDMTLDVENIGDALAPGVTATVSSPNPVVRVITDTATVGDVGVGSVVTASTDVRMRVRTWCAVDATIDLDILFQDTNGDSWTDTVPVDVDCAVTDDDGDGYDINSDCDDTDAAVNPGATEVCDSIDNDCDSAIDEGWTPDGTFYYRDADSDSFGDASIRRRRCVEPAGFVDNDQDCDDTEPTTYPGAPEACDGVDNDCTGTADDGPGAIWYADTDGDLFGDPANTTFACTQPSGYVDNDWDCYDADPFVKPGGIEICNSLDDDCDGTADNGWVPDGDFYYRDFDSDGFGDANVRRRRCAAPAGFVDDDTDCNDLDDTIHPGATELCDGVDQDCDGVADNGGTGGPWYDDADADGYGDASVTVPGCTQPAGTAANGLDCDDGDATVNPGASEACNGVDDDCNGAVPGNEADADADSVRLCAGDCNDADPDVRPGAAELCNGTDDDCDGAIPIDEVDNDSDGSAICEGDCNDGDSAIHPSSPEICNDIDDNCDGVLGTDELDADGDGVSACNGDCNDADPSQLPGAIEQCNGLDDDCSGTLGAPEADVDGDGVMACDGDCDDNEARVYSGADEVCDGLDNDCDLNVDDIGSLTVYDDDDGDGYGAIGTGQTISSCASLAGRVDNDLDCDDTDPEIYYGAPDPVGDGIDQDCGATDDPPPDTGDTGSPGDTGDTDTDPTDTADPCDADGDGYTSLDCGGDDCDDGHDGVYPGASEYLDERDNDCDGLVDNNGSRDTGVDDTNDGTRAACNCDASSSGWPLGWSLLLPLAAVLRRRRATG